MDRGGGRGRGLLSPFPQCVWVHIVCNNKGFYVSLWLWLTLIIAWSMSAAPLLSLVRVKRGAPEDPHRRRPLIGPSSESSMASSRSLLLSHRIWLPFKEKRGPMLVMRAWSFPAPHMIHLVMLSGLQNSLSLFWIWGSEIFGGKVPIKLIATCREAHIHRDGYKIFESILFLPLKSMGRVRDCQGESLPVPIHFLWRCHHLMMAGNMAQLPVTEFTKGTRPPSGHHHHHHS